MTRKARNPVDPNLIAVFHRVGDGGSWLAMLFRRTTAGVAVVETRSFPPNGRGDGRDIPSWLIEKQVAQVLAVLPSSSVICRVVQLPAGSPDRLLPALRLQAEAHLLGGVPPHRVGLAVLPGASSDNGRSGLILAWPESATVDLPPIGDASAVLTCVPEIAAMAALMGNHRPAEPLIWANRDDGSVAIALAHAGGVAYRATREDAADLETWRAGIGRAVAETAFTVGHSQEYLAALMPEVDARIASMARIGLWLPPELVGALVPLVKDGGDPAWWRTHGIAVGAALAAAGDLAPLTMLLPTAPKRSEGPVAETLNRLATPRAAAIAVVAALIALLLAPPVFSGLRLALMNWKLGGLDEYRRTVAQTERRLKLYRELEKSTWPVSKLLADLANNTPEAIELSTISLAYGEGVTIAGDAKPKDGVPAWEAVGDFAHLLNECGVFECTQQRLDADLGHRRPFSLVATVKKPYSEVKYDPDEDFAVNTLADRRYGKQSTSSAVPASATSVTEESPPATALAAADNAPRAPESAGSSGTSRGSRSGSSSSSGPRRVSGRDSASRTGDASEAPGAGGEEIPATESGDATGGGSSNDDGRRLARRGMGGADRDLASRDGRASAVVIPEPLTDAQIDAMSKAEAEEAMSRWAEARLQVGLDEETSERLKREFYRLMAQSRKGS